jgi:multiple sugar transport system permease protein
MPTKEVDYAEMLKHIRQVRWEFLTRNYKMVIQYFLLHGRALYNTFVYIVLAILIALTVTPSAAYAMSRYKLPSTYKILLFFLATMAFPPMVTTIPNFLLLKRLGLLNTFWALVLPGMTSGYFIFLLKGFFDSLPRELYEAAMIDGAGEWVMFWNITMTLSKPILAVIALGAFTAAYGNFMFAFIVNQNQKMWTLMVWLYQLQQFSHQSVTFAALIIAAIPTFLVFLFAQNIILRGYCRAHRKIIIFQMINALNSISGP